MENHEDYKIFLEVSVTDPKYTKSVKVAGKVPFTNIDTYYLIDEATKRFGFYGKGFGLKDISYEYMDIADTKVAIIHATFFFPDGSFPITSSDKFVYKTKAGYDMIDTDIFKKLETNTLAKALSKIGFGADVYRGKFEDYNYVDEAANTHALCSHEQQQKLRKGLGYYQVEVGKINTHFSIATLADLLAKDYNEAEALVVSLSTRKKEEVK